MPLLLLLLPVVRASTNCHACIRRPQGYVPAAAAGLHLSSADVTLLAVSALAASTALPKLLLLLLLGGVVMGSPMPAKAAAVAAAAAAAVCSQPSQLQRLSQPSVGLLQVLTQLQGPKATATPSAAAPAGSVI